MLISGAAAMAFVATNPSGPRLVGKSDTKAKAEFQAQGLRSRMLGRLETLKGVKNGGEGPANEAAQEDYDNRAFPATAIGAAQTRAAANAAKQLGKLPGGKRLTGRKSAQVASLQTRLSRRNRLALRGAPFTQGARQRLQFRRTAKGTTAKSSSARRVVVFGRQTTRLHLS